MLSDGWSQGYVSDVPYTVGYYRELSPSLQQFVLLLQGFSPPGNPGGEFDHFELGFGQGLSLNVHAATHPSGRFWGNDFNPQHALFAKSMAEAGGLSVNIFDDSFEELCSRDLPQFDYISLHGVWSWISEENRKAIIQFMRRKLKPGGAVYVSYNAMPGWAAAMPLRHLIKEHVNLSGTLARSLTGRIRDSLEYAEKVANSGAQYFKINTAVIDRLNSIKQQNASYLAHEYFNRDWCPMYFGDVSRQLGEAKLSYAGSASLLDHIPDLSLTEEMRKVLEAIDVPEFRETVRDYFLNSQFRRDIFIKGSYRLTREQALSRMLELRFMLLTPPEKVTYSVTVGTRKADLQRSIYEPLVEVLSKSDRSMTLAEIQSQASMTKIDMPVLIQALTLLVGVGNVSVHADKSRKQDHVLALNRHISARAEGSAEIGFIVAGNAGCAIPLDRFEQMFMRYACEGKNAQQAAQSAWLVLKARGERLQKDGKPIMDEQSNLAQIESHAIRFYAENLPRLQALGVVL